MPCHVLGRPQPSIKWTKDDKDPDKERSEIEDVGQDSTLIIRKAQRSDAGKYQITAANPSGIKSASTRVEVMGEYLATVFRQACLDLYNTYTVCHRDSTGLMET